MTINDTVIFGRASGVRYSKTKLHETINSEFRLKLLHVKVKGSQPQHYTKLVEGNSKSVTRELEVVR